MNAFERAFDETIGFEGGYVFDPDDPGGETKFGISKRSYPCIHISALTIDKAKAIYYRDYWMACRLDGVMSDKIAAEIFDTAVNMGIKTAGLIAQRAINFLTVETRHALSLHEDGIIGDKTIAALNKWSKKDEKALFICLNGFQFSQYRMITQNNRSARKFTRGWTKRIQQYQTL